MVKYKMLWLIVFGIPLMLGVVVLWVHFGVRPEHYSAPVLMEPVLWSTDATLLFRHGSCDQSIDPYKSEMLGVRDVSWRDDTTLMVQANVVINCGEDILSGSYERSADNTLILSYQSPQCGGTVSCARCICAHELSYTISNIEKNEYNIVLNRVL